MGLPVYDDLLLSFFRHAGLSVNQLKSRPTNVQHSH